MNAMTSTDAQLAAIVPARREHGPMENHAREHPGCGRLGGFGFAKPRKPSHWFCIEHRGDGERYL